MTLESLKEKILENACEFTQKYTKIEASKDGRTRLKLQRKFLIYFDEKNNMYYGQLTHYWLGRMIETKIIYSGKDVISLVNRIKKLRG